MGNSYVLHIGSGKLRVCFYVCVCVNHTHVMMDIKQYFKRRSEGETVASKRRVDEDAYANREVEVSIHGPN